MLGNPKSIMMMTIIIIIEYAYIICVLCSNLIQTIFLKQTQNEKRHLFYVILYNDDDNDYDNDTDKYGNKSLHKRKQFYLL